MNDNLLISKSQLFFFIIQSQIGIGVLSLAFSVFQEAEWDGWLGVFTGGLAIQVAICLMYLLAVRYGDKMFFNALPLIIGKIPGHVLNLVYTLYFSSICILILVLYKHIIIRWLFPQTPGWVLNFLLVFAAWYLTREKLHIIVRFYVFVSSLLILVIGVLFFAIPYINPLYILPIGHHGFGAVGKAVLASMQAMLGFGVFMYIFPYVKVNKKKEILLTATYANIFTTCLYGFTVLITLMFFSPPEIALIPQPLLYMLKTFNTPIVDRLDIIFMAIWIVSVTTSLMTYMYLASLSTTQLIKGVPRKKLVTVIAIAVYFISLGPKNRLTIDKYAEGVDTFGLIMVFGIPLLLYLVSLIRQRGKNGAEDHEKSPSV
ncbi:GerAB/ArcD/ProY family transporter [Alteribacter aurantiacus]|uniref:GerAB/ArcD/ProY family transporter n=1 Tax=Alteribacter aurantiacus TaxID=254410 RepID=UPI00041E2ECE|nr:endospore germination permease [Alteribacter aurantiacus]